MQERTEWHTIVCWDGTAELAHKYLTKGKGVIIHGKIKNEQFLDKEGLKHYVTKIVAERIVFMQRDAAIENNGWLGPGEREEWSPDEEPPF
jgi:single-strand DNA-binding protein